MQRKRLSTTIKMAVALFVCLPVLLQSGTTYPKPDRTQETYKNLEVFSNVLSIIQQDYVEEINVQDVIEGAIKGMLNSLDPHSSFMKPEDFKELQGIVKDLSKTKIRGTWDLPGKENKVIKLKDFQKSR